MQPRSRKRIAFLALIAAAVMLWLERDEIARGTGESIFWLIVAGLAILLAGCELAGVGAKDEPK